MTERDVLEHAFAALRQETSEREPDDERAASTRRALLLLASRRRRRALVFRYALPLVAVLAISTAWAAATGRLPRLLRTTTDATIGEHSPTVSVPPPAYESVPTAAPAPPSAAPAPSKGPAEPVAGAVDREESLYRAAHEAHFVGRDYGRALDAWDAYLAKYPSGRFAPEVRYNRAIALVRLERRDEGREALRPFAEGKYGDYRRQEAKALLDALKD